MPFQFSPAIASTMVLGTPKQQMATGIMMLAMCMAGIVSVNGQVSKPLPADKAATPQTKNLLHNLHHLVQGGAYLVGHQDATAYGVHWKYQPNRSDVKDVTGDFPALYGWELADIEKDNNGGVNIDSVPFATMRLLIQQAYERGGVNTISWHANHPVTGGNAWDTTGTAVQAILPGGSHHQVYCRWLNTLSEFMKGLKSKKGEPIPILFRPFHELTGRWFWWGTHGCTPAQYKALFRFTVQYLQQQGVHQLLYVYNTADFNSEAEFAERFPGNDVVDIVSFDTYQYGDAATDSSFTNRISQQLALAGHFARANGKLLALAETGYEAIPYDNWWTGRLRKAIAANPIAYVMIWRNHGYHETMKKMHYYMPYKGHNSSKDFIQFYKLPETIFQKEAKLKKLYTKF
jgi:mannan endo-1,4-beta-mannosidase